MKDYSELKKLAEAATPGPWAYDGSYVCPARTEDGTTYVELWRSIADCHQPENTKFIAAANPAAVLALIAEVERLSFREKMLSEYGCEYCAGSGHVHRIDGDYLGVCDSCSAYEFNCAKHEIEKLKNENESLKKDAARYQWLRTQNWNDSNIAVVRNPRDAVKLGCNCPSMERLDIYIDNELREYKS